MRAIERWMDVEHELHGFEARAATMALGCFSALGANGDGRRNGVVLCVFKR